jgi:hypothetical protein
VNTDPLNNNTEHSIKHDRNPLINDSTTRSHRLFKKYVDYIEDDPDIPYGKWRDSILDCFRYGHCHPTIFMGLFCIPCAIEQEATQIGMDQNDFCHLYCRYCVNKKNRQDLSSPETTLSSNKVIHAKFYFQFITIFAILIRRKHCYQLSL